MLKENTNAPDFSLADQSGVVHKLSNYLGEWILIYFYPKDNTPGCTKEACAIRDNWSLFKKHKIKVFGISTDSVKSHSKFVDKFSLPFILLSDEEKKVVKKYKAYGQKKFMGMEYEGVFRVSYLINPKGVIVKAYSKVKPDEHAQEIINDFVNLSKK